MQNFFTSHFRQFSLESFGYFLLNLDLSYDVENFKALLRFSD